MATTALLFAFGALSGLETDIHPDRIVGWTKGARAGKSEPIELVVALAQPTAGVKALVSTLEQVSDPFHSRYGMHLTNEAVHDMVAPPAASIASVRAYFAQHGIHDLEAATPNGDMLVARTTIGAVERALGCAYYEYTHKAHGKALRTPSYGAALPSNVKDAIAFASPTVRLPSTSSPRPNPSASKKKAAVEEKEPNSLFNTPNSLRKLYSVGDAVGSASNSRQAVTGFLGQHYSQRDLEEFNTIYARHNLRSKSKALKSVGDDPTGLISGVEAMLDAEYITGLGSNISTEFWGFKGRAPDNPANEPFLKWLMLVANTSDATVPKLFSTSYGEDESSVSTAYADRINVEFVKAGTRGISLLFASGDSGANCKPSSADASTAKGEHFEPNWPAASPYVTTVGGTTGSKPEAAVGLSSGGFSNRYATPAWQASAVAKYLRSEHLPNRSLFNATGRGFPDIAAQATSFMVVANLIPEPVDGTSCASPTAAGVLGLLNDLRLRNGKPPLGFLNPFLYSKAAGAFNDITTGMNGGCFLGVHDEPGYAAVPGWDAVTGLGTPNYEKLAKVVLELP